MLCVSVCLSLRSSVSESFARLPLCSVLNIVLFWFCYCCVLSRECDVVADDDDGVCTKIRNARGTNVLRVSLKAVAGDRAGRPGALAARIEQIRLARCPTHTAPVGATTWAVLTK